MTYSTDFSHIAHFMSLERKIMDYWIDLYSGDIHCIEFEHLLNDFATQTKSVFDYLNLPWSDQVYAFHRDKKFTHTASYNQVNQPISTKPIGQYAVFNKELSSFKQALLENGINN